MIEIIGEVPATANDVIDAYNIIRNECARHKQYCVGCPLHVRFGVMSKHNKCAITDCTPELWEELNHVDE